MRRISLLVGHEKKKKILRFINKNNPPAESRDNVAECALGGVVELRIAKSRFLCQIVLLTSCPLSLSLSPRR